MKCYHEFVPNTLETRKRQKGIWTCIKCGKHQDRYCNDEVSE